jgi:hypothetical protein
VRRDDFLVRRSCSLTIEIADRHCGAWSFRPISEADR